MPDGTRFFAEIAEALRPDAHCLVAEPTGHVSAQSFAKTLEVARQAGLPVVGRPTIWRCHAALLRKDG
jgi:hypothetical protein